MVDIALCSGDRCVSQEFGDGDNIATTAERSQGKRVTERMRADVLGIDASGDGTAVHDVPHGPGTETFPHDLPGRSIVGTEQRTLPTEAALGRREIDADISGSRHFFRGIPR